MYPDTIKATCPKHGVTEFIRVEMADWWMCAEGMNTQSGGDDPNYCDSVVCDETLTHDGATVESSKQVIRRIAS